MRSGAGRTGAHGVTLVELLVTVVVAGVLAAGTAVAGTALVGHAYRATLLAELYAHGKAGLAHAQAGSAERLTVDDFVATAPRLEQVTAADEPPPSRPHAEAVWLHGTHDTTVLVWVTPAGDRAVLAGSREGHTAAVAVTLAGWNVAEVAGYQVEFDAAHEDAGSSGDADVDAGDAVDETEADDGDGDGGGPPCTPPGQGGQPPGQGGLIPGTCELVPPHAEDG